MWGIMKCLLSGKGNCWTICCLYMFVVAVTVCGNGVVEDHPDFVSFLQEPINSITKDSFIVESSNTDNGEEIKMEKEVKTIKVNDKMIANATTRKAVTKYDSELDLESFMRPAHGIILPSHKNASSLPSSLWSFFDKEHETSDGEKDDNDYISDTDDEKSMISPLINLPIITNLITGKSLNINTEKPSSRTIANSTQYIGDDGVDIKVTDKTVGNIMALPDNARMDLEDPLTENDFDQGIGVDKKNQTSNALIALNKTYHHLSSINNFLNMKLNSTMKSKHQTKIQNHETAQSSHHSKVLQAKHNLTKEHNMNQTPHHTPDKVIRKEHKQGKENKLNGTKQPNKVSHINQQSPHLNNNLKALPLSHGEWSNVTSNRNTTHPYTVSNGTQITNHTSRHGNTSLDTKQQHKTTAAKTDMLHRSHAVDTSLNTNVLMAGHKWNQPFYYHANTSNTETQQNKQHNSVKVKPAHHTIMEKEHEISFKNAKKIYDRIVEYAKPHHTSPLQSPFQHSSDASATSQESGSSNRYSYEYHKIKFVQLPPSPDTHCMDGSSPAYYTRKGYGEGQGKWIIHLHGGAWCYDLRSCSKRRNSILGSTKRSLEEDIGGFFHGILSNDPKINPHFYNWNTAVLTYCDGGLFSGNRDKPLVGNGKKYYFQGRRVLRSQLEHIKGTTSLDNANSVILSGTSAGGLSLMLQSNYIRRFLPSLAKVRGLVDAGFFLDQDSIYNTSISNIQFKALYSLHRPTLSRACVENQSIGKKFKCLFPHETIQNVKIPLFLVNSLYDHWQLSYLEGISCVYDDAKCDQLQHDRVLGFRNKMYTALNDVVKYSNTTGVFANSCFAHGQVILDYTWSKAKVNKKTISEAFHEWYNDNEMTSQKRHFHADCKLPCNGNCPRLLAKRCVVNFKKASPQRRKREAELC